jgi:divalent metal cation (Fe/Co/Zn/Cd) transporter
VLAGLATSSLALFGLGANAVLDGAASGVLIWRFRHERQEAAHVEAVEQRAALAVGVIMIAIVAYLAGRSVLALANQSSPEESLVGLLLAAVAVVVLPLIARAKLRLAVPLQSSALRADGVLSLAGAILAAATLLSLLLDVSLGWWWADACCRSPDRRDALHRRSQHGPPTALTSVAL